MNVPALRFPEFEGEWRNSIFSEFCELKGRIGYRGYTVEDIVEKDEGAIALSPSNISSKGDLQSKNDTYISWFKYEESPEIMVENGHILLVKTGSTYGKAALVEGLHNKATVNPQVVVIKPKDADSRFLYSIVISYFFQKQIHETVVGGALPTLSQASVLNFSIGVPPLPEQKKIAAFLGVVDAKIAALQEQVAGLERYKRGLMQALFSQTLRLTKPDGTPFPDWEEKRLGDFLVQHKEKSDVSGEFPVLTSSRRGIFLQSEYYVNREVASEDNAGYNVVPRGYFTYRHMSDDLVFKFNINDIVDKGIVSTLYPVFTTKGLNDYYLRAVLNEGQEFQKYALLQKQGGSRTYMYFNKLAELRLPIPHPDEQAKIAEALSAMDAKIAAVTAQLEGMQAFKKGLLQQMFV